MLTRQKRKQQHQSPVKHVEDKQSDLMATTPARITTPVPLKESTDRPRR